jgi:hypothetical protein
MMQTSKTHWPSLLILIVLALGIFVFLAAALATGLTSIVGLFDGSADPAGMMIRSVAGGFELVLLLICSWFVLQKVMRKEQADGPLQISFPSWQVLAIPLVVLLCIGLGAAVSISEIKWLGWLLLPALTLAAVILPILFFFGIGTRRIELTPRWSAFGMLGLSITLGPLIMIILEIVVLFSFALVAIIFISAQPGLVRELSGIEDILNQGVDSEAAVELLAPYITRPAVIASFLLYLAFFIPLIEELFKPLAVWLFAKQIHSPASGFALGMLSGGAFALMESLNVSGDGSTGWFAIVSVRAGTSLLHVTTSGLMGYAIVRVFHEKQFVRMIAMYLSCAMLHGLWNACAVGTAFATLGEMVGKPEWLWRLLPASLGGLAVLAIGMFALLLAANRKILAVPAAGELMAEERGKITS